MRKTVITLLAALATAIAATPAALAADSAETAAVAVPYADLDLTKPAGNKVLEARIDNALDRVCAKPDLKALRAMREFESCQAEARDAAMEQLSLANPFDGIELASAF